MRPGSFLALLVLTVAVTAAAVSTYMAESRHDGVRLEGAPVLPALTGKLSEVARVEVIAAGGGFTLARRDNGWVVASKHGYPAEDARVKRTLVALANMEKIAAKTRRPALYPRLGVEDPKQPGAQSRLVILRDGAGERLAAVVVGRQRHARTGWSDKGTYVRRPDAARAWLASGLIDLSDDAYPWLETEVVDIAPGAVRRLEIRSRDGGRLLAIRPERDAPAMAIAGIPPGREPDVTKVRRLGSVLAKVKLHDVRPVAAVDFSAPLARAEVVTFDGLRIAVDVVRRDDAYWLRLDVEAPAGDGEARRRAGTIAARVDGWAYKVADYIGERLSRSLDDVLRPDAAS